jgi:hypothetical protein
MTDIKNEMRQGMDNMEVEIIEEIDTKIHTN